MSLSMMASAVVFSVIRGDDGCLLPNPIFKYFKKHEACFMVKDFESEVIDNEDIFLLYLVHFLDVRAVCP